MDLSSILAFGIADLVLLQFSCKPFVSVDVNLDLERKPCLQLDMHQTEVPSIRIRQAAYSVLSLFLMSNQIRVILTLPIFLPIILAII